MAKVTMPQLGESVAEGTIGKWLKQPGDHVDKYEPLVEVITDKVNAEVPSPFEGVLREILAEEGATVPNNAEIAVIETADERAAKPPPRHRRHRPRRGTECRARRRHRRGTRDQGRTGRPAGSPSADRAPRPGSRARAGSAGRRPGQLAAPAAPAATAPAAAAPASDRRCRCADDPAVRRLLREHELSAAQIVGTGGGGRITREDVLNVVESIRPGRVGTRARAAPARHPPRRHPPPRARPRSASHPWLRPHPARRPRRRRPPAARRSCSPRARTKSSLPMTRMR